ncbi:hypothetical protein BJ085DRAFT_34590, partial [Dimargaris cristalligena]
MRVTILSYATLLVSSAHFTKVIQANDVEGNPYSRDNYFLEDSDYTILNELLSDPKFASPQSHPKRLSYIEGVNDPNYN